MSGKRIFKQVMVPVNYSDFIFKESVYVEVKFHNLRIVDPLEPVNDPFCDLITSLPKEFCT